jgi:hypothetical protein
MQYLAGLVVFAGIGSFLITDTIDFWRNLKRRDRRNRWYLDLARLLVLAGLAAIGYKVASETFQQPRDWLIFLALGLVGAFSAQIIRQKLSSSGHS